MSFSQTAYTNPAFRSQNEAGRAARELFERKREIWRRQCRVDLLSWCIEERRIYNQTPARHHRLMIRKLEEVITGKIDRLMIFMPPRHGKSVYTSQIMPAHYLVRRPRDAIIAASHTYDLAEGFGRQVRNTVAIHADTLGYSLAADSKAAGRWNTSRGGQYVAAGVGKAIAGRPGNLIIIDDPVADRKSIESEDQRNHLWNWYRNDVYTRLEQGGRVILVMTRWHEDDLAGRLLQAQEDGGDKWEILMLPALADSEDDQLGRPLGAALWPEWETKKNILRKKAVIGDRDFEALFQQNPQPPEGALFKPAMIRAWEGDLPKGETVRAWDLAATAEIGTNDPSWTVGVKMRKTAKNQLLVMDVVRFRGGPEIVEQRMKETAELDTQAVRVCLPQDPGQAGKSQVLRFTQMLMGYRVSVSPESGKKEERAAPVAAQVNVGNMWYLPGPWSQRAFFDELASFPSGKKSDQVDALSRAFMELMPDGLSTWLKLGGIIS